MAHQQLHLFVRRLRHTLGPTTATLTDAQLLERFVAQRDEAAFEVLVWRHGAMVLGVCGRLLHHEQDAEDVFQATFLALARKAGSIGRREALGGWLHTTACRMALKVRARRPRHQGLVEDVPASPTAADSGADLRPVLDEEIHRLPVKYRLPVILVYLQGQTTAEAARQLGCARGTICSRLSWARQRLRSRLTRRGLALSGAALTAVFSHNTATAGLPAVLVHTTVEAAPAFAAGGTVSAGLAGAATLAEGVLKAMSVNKLKLAAVLLAVCFGGLGAGLGVRRALADRDGTAPELVPGGAPALRLPAESLAELGIKTAEIKPRPALSSRVLRLPGSLALDPARLARVQSRFSGELLEIGKVEIGGESRPILTGDKVRKGQVLAVVWSVDVAEKKSDLLAAWIQLRLDQQILAKMEAAANAVPEITVLNARRNVAADQNAVHRAENALRTWRVTEEEIKAIREEAARIAEGKGKRDPEQVKKWARVEIRAPIDGVVVERSVAVHEFVKPTMNLFQIANLDRLLVIVNAPEDELPTLETLKPEERVWTVQTAGPVPVTERKGRIEEIGYLIDPNQHTVTIKGYIDNAGGRLRAGQFITASIVLPVAREVAVPASAVVEQGDASFVFVQPDPKKLVYQPRRVLVVRRGHEVVHIRSPLRPEEERQGYQSLRRGERIVISGAVELKATLDDLTKEKR